MKRIGRGFQTGIVALMLSAAACIQVLAVGEGWFEQDGNWHYTVDGEKRTGRQEIDGNTYFFDEDGRMLTGWVYCPKGELPEMYTDSTMNDDVYFCNDDGFICTGWAEAMPPHRADMDDGEIFELIADDDYGKQWYYLKKNGQVFYNDIEKINGKTYIFDEEGIRIKGWIYDKGEGQENRFEKVDDDTPDETVNTYNQNPEHYRYGSDEGYLAVNTWFDARKPGDDEDADTRSFYAGSAGYIVTGQARGSGISITARRKATKIALVGSYNLEGWSTDVNIIKIDGKYYCIEDSGTRIDGIFYLQGTERQSVFPNGFYCFDDGAAMETGRLIKKIEDEDIGSDGFYYYYNFADRTGSTWYIGQGITGVDGGRLYYQGLSVAAQHDDYELVYLPTLAEKSEYGTGLFLVDAAGIVQKGSKSGTYCNSQDSHKYKIFKEHDKDDEYGYHIFIEEKNEDGDKVLTPVGSDEADYIFWDAVED